MGDTSSVGTRAAVAFGMAVVALIIAYVVFSFEVGGKPADEAIKEIVEEGAIVQ